MVVGRLLVVLTFPIVFVQCQNIDYFDDSYYHPDIGGLLRDEEIVRDKSATSATPATYEDIGEFWKHSAQNRLLKHLEIAKNTNRAKNVIFFIGDGMSIPTLSAARAYVGQHRGYTNAEEFELEFEKFPVTGLSKTYCLNYQVADSACSATAYLGGAKARYGTIGVDGSVARKDCETSLNSTRRIESIAKWAIDAGKSAGIVTTTRVTHASPAGAYAHTAERNWEADSDVASDNIDPTRCRDIAYQLVNGYPGKHFKVILGGGRQRFRPTTHRDEESGFGRRADGKDLIADWQLDRLAEGVKYEYAWNRDQLMNLRNETDYLLGLFEPDHLQYNLEADALTEPTLAEMVEAAIKVVSKNEKGYFLFVEGGRIDHGHHNVFARIALDETMKFSEAVGKAVEMTSSADTLIVVSSDHSHVMTHNGYPSRGRDPLGASGSNGADGIPYTILSYANGPGYRKEEDGRIDVTKEDMTKPRFKYPSLVPLSSETHGGDDVAVFAYGPQQHIFSGIYEQNLIPHLLGYASCLGPGRTLCSAASHVFARNVAFLVMFSFFILKRLLIN